MTLTTTVYVLDEVDRDTAFVRCRALVGASDRHTFTDEPAAVQETPVGPAGEVRMLSNHLNQGLPAWIALWYRLLGPLRATAQSAAHGKDCNVPGAPDYDEDEQPCDGQHDPACWLEVTFDSDNRPDEQGNGPCTLHAGYLAELGAWLDRRGLRWAWQDGFTLQVHQGHDGIEAYPAHDRRAPGLLGPGRAVQPVDRPGAAAPTGTYRPPTPQSLFLSPKAARADAESVDDAVVAQVVAVLAEHHPAAVFDESDAVSRPGFLAAPGAPGQGQARVQHRTLFPSALSGVSFADAAEQELVFVEAYADLLRARGWEVRYQPTTRPNLLVSPPAEPRGGRELNDSRSRNASQ